MSLNEMLALGIAAPTPFVAAGLTLAATDGVPIDTVSGAVERFGFPVVVTGAAAWCAWRLVDRILTRAEKREDEARDMLNERHGETLRFASQVLEGNKLLSEAVQNNAKALETFSRINCARRESNDYRP
jgi:hypothetical protein